MRPLANVWVVFSMMLLLLPGNLAAQIEPKDRLFKARVPFAFQVGDMHFPPGIYTLSHLGPQVTLIEKDDRSATGMLLVQTETVPLHKNIYPGMLVFKVYRDHRFLSQVWTGADRQIHQARKYVPERKLEASVRATTVSIRANQ
jgi:hypothetical protein